MSEPVNNEGTTPILVRPTPPPRNLPRPPQRVIPSDGIPVRNQQNFARNATAVTPRVINRNTLPRGVPPPRGIPVMPRGNGPAPKPLPRPRAQLPSPRARPSRNVNRPFPSHMQTRGGHLPVGVIPGRGMPVQLPPPINNEQQFQTQEVYTPPQIEQQPQPPIHHPSTEETPPVHRPSADLPQFNQNVQITNTASPRAVFATKPTPSLMRVTNYSGPDLTDIALKGSAVAVKKALEAGAPIDKPGMSFHVLILFILLHIHFIISFYSIFR